MRLPFLDQDFLESDPFRPPADDDDDDDDDKKDQSHCKWKQIHEEFFMRYDLAEWPPTEQTRPLQSLGFSLRSSEVIIACHLKWGAEPGGDEPYELFDADMTLERLTGVFAVASLTTNKNKQGLSTIRKVEPQVSLERICPCFTGTSKMVCRELGRTGDVSFRFISPTEILHMNGCDHALFRQFDDLEAKRLRTIEGFQNPISLPSTHAARCKRSTMASMAGNMWSAYHFIPVWFAALGCVDWKEVRTIEIDRPAEDSSGDASGDGSDGSESRDVCPEQDDEFEDEEVTAPQAASFAARRLKSKQRPHGPDHLMTALDNLDPEFI